MKLRANGESKTKTENRRERAWKAKCERANVREVKQRKEKNGKCSTHSDIKLILFIMHQSNRALLARAYIMQKQVLPFRSLLYFRDIYSDYALFTVSATSSISALALVKKWKFRRL